MKHLIKAIRDAPFESFYSSIDKTFEKFQKEKESELSGASRDWKGHILAQALQVLRKEKVYFAEQKDLDEYEQLVSLVKTLKEEKSHEEKQAVRRRAQPAKRSARQRKG